MVVVMENQQEQKEFFDRFFEEKSGEKRIICN
jgi:hypothetical protein